MKIRTGSKSHIVNGFAWNLLERFGSQCITFIVSIILARLLDPVVYGLVAMAIIITSILGVFVDSGLGNALVQKKEIDETDLSTVFYFNISMCSALYLAIYFFSPAIADFYEMPELTIVIRVSSLSLIISGFKNILIAIIQRNLAFKNFFLSTLISTLLAAIVGLLMAYNGYGVWALIVQMLLSSTVSTVILYIIVGWCPKSNFSICRLKELFPFGIRILLTNLVSTIYNKLRDLIIGKNYSAIDLAFYNKGSGWPHLLFANIGGAVDSVMFPVMSNAQDDKKRIAHIMSKTISMNTYFVFPLLIGLSLCAEPLVRILITEKWLPIVEYMRIFCFMYAVNTIGNTEMNMIRSIGRSDWFLRLEIIKRGVDLVAILLTMHISVKAMAYSLIITSIIGLIANMIVVKQLIRVKYSQQIHDFSTNLLLSIFMAIPVLAINPININDWAKLSFQIIVGITTYSFLSKLLKIEHYDYLINIIKNKISRAHPTNPVRTYTSRGIKCPFCKIKFRG